MVRGVTKPYVDRRRGAFLHSQSARQFKLCCTLDRSGSTALTADGGSDGNGNDQGWCPIHNVEMKRWEKDGRVWFSHKVGDQWCTGKVKSQ